MISPEALAQRALEFFEGVNRDVFRGDPAANTRLKVEVVEEAMVDDTPTFVLITPWTLNGMAFPPDGRFPESLAVGARECPVFRHEIQGLGEYCSVNLVPDVSRLQSPEAARSAADALASAFREGVAAARADLGVENPDRRSLLKGLRPSSNDED